MTSAKDDHDDLYNDGVDIGIESDANNAADAEIIDEEPLSAFSSGKSAADYDREDDDDLAEDFGDDPIAAVSKKKKSGGATKLLAPLLVLLLAGTAGVYIVTNPQIISSLTQGDASAPAAQPANPVAVLPSDIPSPAPEVVQEVAVGDVPPQPVANLNEVPVQPEAAPEGLPAVAEVTADPAASVVPPQGDVVSAGAMEVVAGSDLAASTDAVDVQGQVAAPDASAIQPETSAVPAPDAAAPADIAAAAETPVAPPAENAGILVEAPADPVAGFVPAPPPTDANAVPVASVPEAPGAVAPAMPAAMEAPSSVTAPAPAPAPALGGKESGTVASNPAPMEGDSGSDTYYDSMSEVPTGEIAKAVGPREINPVLEPASKMIIVDKGAGPDSSEALLVAANRALKLKRYDSALEMFDQLYAKNKRDARIIMGRAIAQQNMGLTESAIQSYEEVLKLKPDNKEALVNMMGLIRAQYPEVALRRLLELYARNPNDAGIAAQIGITNADLGHYDDALRYLGIASTLDPTNAQHLFNMGIAADRSGKRADAIRLYERALETDVMYGASRSIPRESIYDRLSILRRG